MYYILKCPYGPNEATPSMLSYQPDDSRRLWDTGVKFNDDAGARPHDRHPPTPIRLKMVEAGSGVLKELWQVPACLMTKRLLQTLRELGVTNIDDYETEIVDSESGKTHTDYVAFNLVGLVAATDEGNEDYDLGLRWCDSLALKDKAPGDSLLFRLKESPFRIIVHQKVKDHLEAAGFDSLEFIESEV